MWFSPDQFVVIQQLKDVGLAARFEPGDVVIRGFADLGYEEFQVLPSQRLLSLTAGTISAIDPQHHDHFLWVPSVEEAVELIEKKGVIIDSLCRVDSRRWQLEWNQHSRGAMVVTHAQLHTTLLLALIEVIKDEVQDR